jgi:hypothetical protein
MSDPDKTIHVSPMGENWEVETVSGTVAQAESREEAMEAAREKAEEVQAESILVHTSDGSVQQEVTLERPKDETEPEKEQ